ncbi:hypothetical protein QQZ08_005364 [Neonectria magnoliae]|uniref:Major facilitator superfamily (MFS) profile domain-containing protein n=1 Tax=Neonectria magnoliae TaxID=2732573 RepID=A0ABR1I3S4_9HYPO
MDGVAGLEGWRWIFIIEGILTVIVGVMCIFLLCDTPALSTKWLEADEIRYLELRQLSRRLTSPSEYKDGDSHFNLAIFKDILFDYKTYLLTFANWSNAVPNYAMKFTMPSILTGMGYTASTAQLMTIPPYAVGAVSAYGLYPILPGVNAWNVANTPDPAKRSINIDLLVCVGNTGGPVGSYVYLAIQPGMGPRGPLG